MSLDASDVTGGASVETGAQAPSATGTVQEITSVGLTVVITNATGPVVNLEVAGGGLFPGYGGAPPAIAAASAAGVAGTSSRSDHTHAQDLSVVYVPSRAAVQASGVLQQTYAAPNATPSVLNVAANLIPFGSTAGTGLLATQPGFGQVGNGGAGPLMFLDTSNVTPATASIAAQVHLIAEAGFSVAGYIAGLYADASTFGSRYRFQRSRGTFAAPTSVAAQDAVGEMNFEAHNGTSFLRSAGFLGYVDDTAAIDATHSPIDMMMAANNGAALTHPVPSTQVTQLWSYAGDIVNGFTALAPAATQGFIWERAMTSAGNPTGVPIAPTRIGVATSALATVVNPAQLRRWSYISGAWHFLQFMDYDPGANVGRIPFVGATVHTLADSAALTFSSAVSQNRLTVGTAGAGAGSLLVNSGSLGIPLVAALTTGINVTDTTAGGQANIACDDNFFGQQLIGYTNGAFATLTVGVHGGSLFNLGYAMDGTGAATTTAQMDGTTGVLSIGDTAVGAKWAVQVIPTTGGNLADVMLGNTGLVAASAHGFPYLPSVPARPTGAPNAFAGGFAVCVDLTTASAHALYIRNPTGGQWEPIPTFITTAAAGAGVPVFTTAPAAVVSLNAKWWTFKDSTGTQTYIPYFQ